MLIKKNFESQLGLLQKVLACASLDQEDSNDEIGIKRRIEAMEVRPSSLTASLSYLYIRTRITYEDQKQILLESTISYHTSYQEPVINFRVWKLENNTIMCALLNASDEHFTSEQEIIDLDGNFFEGGKNETAIGSLKLEQVPLLSKQLPILDLTEVIQLRCIDINFLNSLESSIDPRSHKFTSRIYHNKDKKIPDIEEILAVESTEDEKDAVGRYTTTIEAIAAPAKISIDYHPAIISEPWFFLHPCDTNYLLPQNYLFQNTQQSERSYSQRMPYLITWFSIYGPFLNIRLRSHYLAAQKLA